MPDDAPTIIAFIGITPLPAELLLLTVVSYTVTTDSNSRIETKYVSHCCFIFVAHRQPIYAITQWDGLSPHPNRNKSV